MDLISVFLDPVFPVFAIALAGFLMGRADIVAISDARVVNRVATSIFLPLMLFGIIATAPVATFELRPLLLYVSVELFLFAAGFLVARRVFRLDPAEATLLSFCVVFVNHVFYVLPLGIFLYGQENILPITAIITFDGCVLFAAMIITVQIIRLGEFAPGKIVRTLASTPLLIGIFGGIAFNLSGLSLTGTLETFITFNGVAGPPMAMFALGVVLSKTEFSFDPAVILFTAISLVAQPLLVWLMTVIAGIEGMAGDLVTFTAAGPAGVMAMVLALLHGVRTSLIAQVIVWSSFFSLFTLTLLA